MSFVKDKYPMVSLITYIIGLYDPYGVNHSERVAQICLWIGSRIGLTADELEVLELSALLHDIGKLGIPESTRIKPGALTEAEYFMMRQHPAMGLNIVRRMNGSISEKVHLSIFHHHEDWGGTGYPAGLKGEAIPLEARVIRIADTFDALTHSRGYRPPLTVGEALQLMVQEQEVKQLYDPNLFRVFLDLVVEK